LNPNLNPTQLNPFLDPEGQPNTFELENWDESKKMRQVWPH